MSRLRVPGRRWCKDLTARQLAALLFLADCPGGVYSWIYGYGKRPREFHASTLKSLESRGLIETGVEVKVCRPSWRRINVRLRTAGCALVAAYRYGYEAGIEAE